MTGDQLASIWKKSEEVITAGSGPTRSANSNGPIGGESRAFMSKFGTAVCDILNFNEVKVGGSKLRSMG